MASWRTPRSLTSVFELAPERVAGLRAELNRVGDAVVSTPGLALDHVETLQSFRVHTVVDPDGEFAPLLLVNTVFDGDEEAHLVELRVHAGEWLATVLARHAGVEVTPVSLPGVLQLHRASEDARYLGVVGATRRDTRLEERLREVLTELADARRDAGEWGPGSPAEPIRASMRAHVLSLKDGDVPSGPAPRQTGWSWLLQRLDAGRAFLSPFSGLLHGEMRKSLLPPGEPQPLWKRALLELGLALHWAWTALPTTWALSFVRQLEDAEQFEPAAVDADAVRALQHREDQRQQNPLSACTRVKPGPGRQWVLRRILAGSEDALRHIWNRGALAGIDTIHVARILHFDRGRRLLFLSDYDGSWERYLADFLGVGSVAVVPIFSNMRTCPPTRDLFEPLPPRFAPRFLAFTRRSQNPVEVWYSAWPELSVPNRLSNRRLREGLFAESMSAAEATEWLRELG